MVTRKVISIIAITLILGLEFSYAVEYSSKDFVRVAVVPFVNVSGIEERDAWGHGVAGLMFTRKLTSTKGIVTYKIDDLILHLKQLNKTIADCTTKAVALALGKRCYADWVVYGTLDDKSGEIDVSVKLLEVAKNKEHLLYSKKTDESGVLH